MPPRWLIMAIVALAGAVLGIAVAAPPPAAAGPDGVTFDQNSPAGREYAIPLHDARRQYASDGGSERADGSDRSDDATGAAEQPPLFGRGVKRASDAGADRDGRRRAGAPAAPTASRAAARRLAAIQAAGDASSGAALGFGLAAAVVLLGSGLGFALRLRKRRP